MSKLEQATSQYDNNERYEYWDQQRHHELTGSPFPFVLKWKRDAFTSESGLCQNLHTSQSFSSFGASQVILVLNKHHDKTVWEIFFL